MAVLEDAARRPVPGGAVGAPARWGGGRFQLLPVQEPRLPANGGAIATSDDAVAEMANILRFHGSRDRATWEHVGYSSRLDEVQVARRGTSTLSAQPTSTHSAALRLATRFTAGLDCTAIRR